jgi:hypothetical protein
MMDLAAFEHDPPFVLEALRQGELDHLETVSEAAAAGLFRHLISRQVLDRLAESYPRPRQREDVPVWLYVASEISLKLHGAAAYHAYLLVLRSGGLISALGPKAGPKAPPARCRDQKDPQGSSLPRPKPPLILQRELKRQQTLAARKGRPAPAPPAQPQTLLGIARARHAGPHRGGGGALLPPTLLPAGAAGAGRNPAPTRRDGAQPVAAENAPAQKRCSSSARKCPAALRTSRSLLPLFDSPHFPPTRRLQPRRCWEFHSLLDLAWQNRRSVSSAFSVFPSAPAHRAVIRAPRPSPVSESQNCTIRAVVLRVWQEYNRSGCGL